MLAVTAVAVFGLAGCARQTPEVSLHGGGSTVHSTAVGWCANSDQRHCHTDKHRIPVLRVAAGTKLNVDVSAVVAKRAWVVLTDGKITSPVEHGVRFYKIKNPVPPNASFLLQVQTLGSAGQNITVTGNWVFRVTSA